MSNSELSRALLLDRLMKKSRIAPDDFMEKGYTAVVLHSSSTLFACNPALTAITGYSTDEILGMNAWCLFPPESIPIVKQKLSEQSEDPYQVNIRRKDGTQLRVELKGKNIEIANEGVRVILAKVID